jgi:2-oxoglutarate ferredoxin oxidoreductase subunit beta
VEALLVHDPGRDDPGLAFQLAKLSSDPTGPTPIGVFRDVTRPVYGRSTASDGEAIGDEDLGRLLMAGETWTIA